MAVLVCVYLFVVPIFVLYLADIMCARSPSEFCGLWIIVVAPQVMLLADYIENDFALTLPMIIGSLIGTVALVFIVAEFVKKYASKKLNLTWRLIIACILFPVTLFLVNIALYPNAPSDWQAWSKDAVVQGNPNLCLNKVEAYYQTDCLLNAARISQDESYCVLLDDPAFSQVSSKADCLTVIQVIKNASKELCSTDYDSDCLKKYCLERLAEQSYYCPGFESGSLLYAVDSLASKVKDRSICDLYEGAPNDSERISACQTGVK